MRFEPWRSPPSVCGDNTAGTRADSSDRRHRAGHDTDSTLDDELSRRAHDARDRMTAARVERIGRALEFVGIAGSDTPLWSVSGPKE